MRRVEFVGFRRPHEQVECQEQRWGQKTKGKTTIRMMVVIWKSPHGGFGQVRARKPAIQTLNTVSVAMRLKK